MQIGYINSISNFDHQGEVFTPQGKSRLSHFLGDYECQNLQILVINIVWYVDVQCEFFSNLTTRGGCLLYRVNHNFAIFSEAINARTFKFGILTQFGMQITWVNSFFKILTTRGGCLLYRVNHDLAIFSETMNARTFKFWL